MLAWGVASPGRAQDLGVLGLGYRALGIGVILAGLVACERNKITITEGTPEPGVPQPDQGPAPTPEPTPDPMPDTATPDPEPEVMDAGMADAQGEDEAVCEDFTLVLKPSRQRVASMMLVVDRSRSMLTGGRWGRMKEALREVTSALEQSVAFGLLLLPDPLSEDECATGSVLADPALMTAAQVNTGLDFWEPNGGTPTALSLNTAGDVLRRVNPEGDNWVLLATDGGPGCNLGLGPGCRCIPDASCENQPGNCLDDVRTLDAVRALRARGIKTLVIGIPGTASVSELLDQMAIEGGTDVEGRHQAVEDLDLLLATLRANVGAVVPCAFTFREAPEDLDGLTVTIDGAPIDRDATHVDGWDIEGELLTLYGGACARIRDGLAHTIAAGLCD